MCIPNNKQQIMRTCVFTVGRFLSKARFIGSLRTPCVCRNPQFHSLTLLRDRGQLEKLYAIVTLRNLPAYETMRIREYQRKGWTSTIHYKNIVKREFKSGSTSTFSGRGPQQSSVGAMLVLRFAAFDTRKCPTHGKPDISLHSKFPST